MIISTKIQYTYRPVNIYRRINDVSLIERPIMSLRPQCDLNYLCACMHLATLEIRPLADLAAFTLKLGTTHKSHPGRKYHNKITDFASIAEDDNAIIALYAFSVVAESCSAATSSAIEHGESNIAM